MKETDSITSKEISWVDYCDALAIESMFEFQKRSLLAKKQGSSMDTRDDGKTVLVPKESSIVNGAM